MEWTGLTYSRNASMVKRTRTALMAVSIRERAERVKSIVSRQFHQAQLTSMTNVRLHLRQRRRSLLQLNHHLAIHQQVDQRLLLKEQVDHRLLQEEQVDLRLLQEEQVDLRLLLK